MHVTGRNLAFVLANTIAVLVALYIAFASNLERPYWAMFTIFIVAKPITGAVRSKSAFRAFGTLAGAAMALLLVPPLVQALVLLCLALSLWIGVCLYLSMQDRRPRSYAFLLAGYTAAIVGLAVVNEPTTIFDTSVARIEEISLGVVCAAVAHSVFFPQNMLEELTGRIDRMLQSGARTCRCDRQQLLRRKIDGLFLALGGGWDEATPLAKTASEAAALRPTKD